MWRLIIGCVHLKYKFAGIYAADNFPLYFGCQSILTVNSDKANQKSTHWLLRGRKKDDDLVFADPLGLPVHYYKHICDWLSFADFGVREFIEEPLQKLSSDLCRLYCINIAQYIFSGYYPTKPFISEKELF